MIEAREVPLRILDESNKPGHFSVVGPTGKKAPVPYPRKGMVEELIAATRGNLPISAEELTMSRVGKIDGHLSNTRKYYLELREKFQEIDVDIAADYNPAEGQVRLLLDSLLKKPTSSDQQIKDTRVGDIIGQEKVRKLTKVALGLKSPKPVGYWTTERIQQEAKAFHEEFGQINGPCLRASNQGGLLRAIERYYPGSMMGIRSFLGVKGIKRGYWTKEIIERDVRVFYEEFGELTYALLTQHGRSDLRAAIPNYYPGEMRALQEELGLKKRKRGNGYWTLVRIEQEAIAFFEEFGKLAPTILRQRGRRDLLATIQTRYPGGMGVLKSKLGISLGRKNNYWSQETIEKETRLFIEDGGELVTSSFKERKRRDLLTQISNIYPGGMYALAQEMGQEIRNKPKNYWTRERMEEEAMTFYERFGLLTQKGLTQQGKSGFLGAINKKYPGGLSALKLKLGIIGESPGAGPTDLEKLLEL